MKKPASKPAYKIESVIVCDDARREVTGKEILIGVYNSVAFVNAFPAGFAQLFFRIAVRIHELGKNDFTIALEEEGGAGRTFFEMSQSVQIPDMETPALLGFALQNFVADKPMTLLLKFRLGRGQPETIATFKIRHPLNEEERQRLSI
jgi:hypothetical protein